MDLIEGGLLWASSRFPVGSQADAAGDREQFAGEFVDRQCCDFTPAFVGLLVGRE